MEKEKPATAVTQQENNEFKKAVDEVADQIIEDLKEGYQSELETFDAYAQRVREEVHADMLDFRHHFLKGYDVLLEELTQRYGKEQARDEKPPPGAIIL